MSDRAHACPIILVMEDEPLQRMTLVDLVEEAGFEAVTALGAEEAVRVLEARPDIRLVIADIDMPDGVDGLKLAASIRHRWPPIGLIITSGRRKPKLDEIPARGVFFSKPYSLDKLVAAMQRFAA